MCETALLSLLQLTEQLVHAQRCSLPTLIGQAHACVLRVEPGAASLVEQSYCHNRHTELISLSQPI